MSAIIAIIVGYSDHPAEAKYIWYSERNPPNHANIIAAKSLSHLALSKIYIARNISVI